MSSVIKYLSVLIVMSLIFFFSSQDGVASSNLSMTLYNEIAIYVKNDFVRIYFRKFAHVFEYFILYLVLVICIKPHDLASSKAYLLVLVFALSDEFHQTFVSGRCGSVKDVLIDSTLPFLITLASLFFYKPKIKELF